MAKYLRLFQTVADRQAAELDYPNVNYTIENDSLEILESAPVPPVAFGGLTVKYYIEDPTVEVTLFNGGGGSSTSSSSSSSSSGSGGGGGVMPTRMIVDGNEETPINTWRFETAGEHIVQYEFEDNTVPSNFLFEITTATEAIIGDDITIIGNTAFQGSTITSVTIPDSVTSIGNGAFGGCTNLINIIVPDSVTSIGGAAFNGCSSLASVSLGSGVTTINGSAFSYCSSLTNITIPDSVTSIGGSAFQSCSGLTSITVEATTPPTLSNTNAFSNTNNCPIYVPAASVNTYKEASGWSVWANRIQPIS